MLSLPFLIKVIIALHLIETTSGDGAFDSQSEIKSRVKRVIGGQPANLGDWPYLVHLKGKVPTKLLFGKIPLNYKITYCTGALLNKEWVITAAHCFRDTKAAKLSEVPKYWHIKAGEIFANTGWHHSIFHKVGKIFNIESMQTWILHAKEIIIHPNYTSSQNWANDIALVKLENELPLETDENMDYVSLPSSDESWPPQSAACYMKGWGCLNPHEGISNRAMSVQLFVTDNQLCRRTFGISTNRRLCANGLRRTDYVGICEGDSGGPLVCDDPYGRKSIAGIASFTAAGNSVYHPSVYTRVSFYKEWIVNTIRTH